MLYDQQGQRKYLNALERRRFAVAARQLSDTSASAFCLTLCLSGCRISEALALTPRRIDTANNSLVFMTLKQRGVIRFRPVAIPATLTQDLARLSRKTPQDAAIWQVSRTTAWRIVKRCMDAAGIRGAQASPKGLRHGYAISCIENGVPITTVQKWLGHSRLSTTSIYLDFAGADERKLARRTWENL